MTCPFVHTLHRKTISTLLQFIKYLVFYIQGVENLVFQSFWLEIASISIEIQGFQSIKGLSFAILGILKIYDYCIPYKLAKI